MCKHIYLTDAQLFGHFIDSIITMESKTQLSWDLNESTKIIWSYKPPHLRNHENMTIIRKAYTWVMIMIRRRSVTELFPSPYLGWVSLPTNSSCNDCENMCALFVIIKSEVWTIEHCLRLDHETIVCAVCLLTCIYVCNTAQNVLH